jgi:hypothetical protein
VIIKLPTLNNRKNQRAAIGEAVIGEEIAESDRFNPPAPDALCGLYFSNIMHSTTLLN